MDKKEAKEYLDWYRQKVSEYHFLAHFKSSRPFHVDFPDAEEKKRLAQITLGIHQWQRPYEQLVKRYPNLTREKYEAYRKKHGLT